jgi:uncharacterized membrane protein
MKRKLLVAAAALWTFLPASTLAGPPHAAVVVRGGYYGGYYGGGWYAPFWGPYWGPGGFYAYYPNIGQIKIETPVKDARVYIDKGYAGTTKENKSISLRPGAYNLEIKVGDKTQYAERIYVAPGKTIKIRPAL